MKTPVAKISAIRTNAATAKVINLTSPIARSNALRPPGGSLPSSGMKPRDIICSRS
jgi:hypothetical protein